MRDRSLETLDYLFRPGCSWSVLTRLNLIAALLLASYFGLRYTVASGEAFGCWRAADDAERKSLLEKWRVAEELAGKDAITVSFLAAAEAAVERSELGRLALKAQADALTAEDRRHARCVEFLIAAVWFSIALAAAGMPTAGDMMPLEKPVPTRS